MNANQMSATQWEHLITGLIFLALGITALIAVILNFVSKKAKAGAEAQQRRQSEIRARIAGQKYAVVIRTRDGRKTSLETKLIGTLNELGAKVYSLSPSEGDKLLGNGEVPERLANLNPILSFILGTSHDEGPAGCPWTKNYLDLRVMKFPEMKILGASPILTLEDGWEKLVKEALLTIASSEPPTELDLQPTQAEV